MRLARALPLLFPIAVAHAATPLGEWCEQQWETASVDSGSGLQSSYGDMLTRWQQYGAKCTGTVAYEARLAFLYAQLHQPDKARAVLKTVAAKKSDYDYLVEIALLQIELNEVLATNPRGRRPELVALEQKYAAYVAKYPNFVPGYSILGGMQSTLGDHEKAVSTLLAALDHTPKEKRRSPNLWSVYRNLTVSAAQMGKYRLALGAADVAYELRKGISSDPGFVLALAKADAATGDFKAAQTALAVIAARVPLVKHDPEYQEIVRFISAKMQQAKPAK